MLLVLIALLAVVVFVALNASKRLRKTVNISGNCNTY